MQPVLHYRNVQPFHATLNQFQGKPPARLHGLRWHLSAQEMSFSLVFVFFLVCLLHDLKQSWVNLLALDSLKMQTICNLANTWTVFPRIICTRTAAFLHRNFTFQIVVMSFASSWNFNSATFFFAQFHLINLSEQHQRGRNSYHKYKTFFVLCGLNIYVHIPFPTFFCAPT